MKKKIVVFGTGRVAEVVHYYMSQESDYEVAGFTVDKQYLPGDAFLELPAVPFERIEEHFPADAFDLFVALGYQEMNRLREEKVRQAGERGYRLASFIHPRSGLPQDAEVGQNCFIMNHVCIQPRVRLGDNVFVWSGAMIGHHSRIGDNCWITSCASISGIVEVGKNCFFAVNSTVGHRVKIGDRCFLGANSLVTRDLKDGQVVIEKSSEVIRLNSDQFLRLTDFE